MTDAGPGGHCNVSACMSDGVSQSEGKVFRYITPVHQRSLCRHASTGCSYEAVT